jgi:hypothetical protein
MLVDSAALHRLSPTKSPLFTTSTILNNPQKLIQFSQIECQKMSKAAEAASQGWPVLQIAVAYLTRGSSKVPLTFLSGLRFRGKLCSCKEVDIKTRSALIAQGAGALLTISSPLMR